MLYSGNGEYTEINLGLFQESLCMQEMHKIWAYKNDQIDAACVPQIPYKRTKYNGKARKT